MIKKRHIWLTIYPSNKCDYKKNIILIKYVQKLVDQKMLHNPMKKKVYYGILKDQNSKNEWSKKWRSWKNLINYIKWKPWTISLSTMSCLTR